MIDGPYEARLDPHDDGSWSLYGPFRGNDGHPRTGYLRPCYTENAARLLADALNVVVALVAAATQTDEHGWVECVYCLSLTGSGDGHNEECPVPRARKVLADLDTVVD
jgi:hypothetical protein